MNRPKFVAEVACNHQGSLEIAERMVRVAADFCRVDVVKFQKRNPELIADKNALHPNPAFAFGQTYYEHRKALEFSVADHLRLKALCSNLGVEYACSVFDIDSAREIADVGPAYIKLGSAVNQDEELIKFLLAHWEGEIHMSLGMISRAETDAVMELFKHESKRLVLYACTTAYPCEAKDACVLEIQSLQKRYGDVVKSIGYSGHHQGIAIDIAAQTLGASHIERHLTLNRTWRGTDHAASLEPDGFRRLVKYANDVALALDYKCPSVLECEQPARRKYKCAG